MIKVAKKLEMPEIIFKGNNTEYTVLNGCGRQGFHDILITPFDSHFSIVFAGLYGQCQSNASIENIFSSYSCILLLADSFV